MSCHDERPYMTSRLGSFHECASNWGARAGFFYFKIIFLALKCCFFDLEMLLGWSGTIYENMLKIQIFIIFSHFLWHISSSVRVFLLTIWADIKPNQSSNIVLDKRLSVSWKMKCIYQKLMVKVSEDRTSAETPKTSRRPVQGQR